MDNAWAQTRDILRNRTQVLTNSLRDTVARSLRGALDVPGRVAGGVGLTALSPDGRLLLAQLADGTIRSWWLDEGVEAGDGSLRTAPLASLSVARDGLAALGITQSGEALLWTPGSMAAPSSRGQVAAAALSPDGQRLVLADADGGVRVTDTATGATLSRLAAGGVQALAWSADGALVLTGGRDGSLTGWDAATGSSAGQAALGDTVARLVPLASGLAVAADGDGRIVTWDPRPGGAPARMLTRLRSAPTLLSADPMADRLLLADARGQTRMLDLADRREVWRLDGTVRSGATHPSGRVLLATADGDLSIWDGPAAQRLLRLIPARDGWIAVDDRGRYDGTAGTLEGSGWTTSAGRLGLAGFSASHYEPRLLATILNPQTPFQTAAPPAVEDAFPTPPGVRLDSTASTDPGSVDITVTAQDRGGGIAEIRLRHNGKAVDPTRRLDATAGTGADGLPTLTERYRLTLVAGDNIVQATGLSRDGIEGQASGLSLPYAAPPSLPDLHLVAVGINLYTHNRGDKFSLDYAVPDALALTDRLNRGAGTLYRRFRPTVLKDALAGRAAILEAIAGLSATRPEDVVILYLAGHGKHFASQRDWFFLPADIPNTAGATEEEVRRASIGGRELRQALMAVPAQRIVLLIDTCQSGEAVRAFDDAGGRRALTGVADAAGIHVLAATRHDEDAVEFTQLQHGAFTYALLRGIGGEADPGQPQVLTTRLITYAERSAPTFALEEAQKLLREQIRSRSPDPKFIEELRAFKPPIPVAFSRGADFPMTGVVAAPP